MRIAGICIEQGVDNCIAASDPNSTVGRNHQCSKTFSGTLGFDIGPAVYQELHTSQIIDICKYHQWRISARVFYIDIGTASHGRTQISKNPGSSR